MNASLASCWFASSRFHSDVNFASNVDGDALVHGRPRGLRDRLPRGSTRICSGEAHRIKRVGLLEGRARMEAFAAAGSSGGDGTGQGAQAQGARAGKPSPHMRRNAARATLRVESLLCVVCLTACMASGEP